MGQVSGSEKYCHLIHGEDKRSFVRRIHMLAVQDRFGTTHFLSGDKLPTAIYTYCGQIRKGHHLGEILLNTKPPSKWRRIVFEKKPWPSPRDLLNFAIGFFAMSMLNSIASFLGMF